MEEQLDIGQFVDVEKPGAARADANGENPSGGGDTAFSEHDNFLLRGRDFRAGAEGEGDGAAKGFHGAPDQVEVLAPISSAVGG